MNVPATSTSSLPQIIERAAMDPTFDIDKLQRLLDMREAEEIRNSDKAFTAAHASAEAEMEMINTDASNPQTRSKYATFAQVDRAVRPIYTRHGFGISFTTEPMSTPDSLLVVGTLAHRSGASRRYQIPVPIVTKGIQGREMMTPIHATMSAVSYGKRNLEILMFNLAIGDDDDGNAASRRSPPRPSAVAPTPVPAATGGEVMDPVTGEVTEVPHQDPRKIVFGGAWRPYCEVLVAALRQARTIDEVDQWLMLNQDRLLQLMQENKALYKTLEAAISTVKEAFTG